MSLENNSLSWTLLKTCTYSVYVFTRQIKHLNGIAKAIMWEIYTSLLPEGAEVLVTTEGGTEGCALRKSLSCLLTHWGLLHVWTSTGRQAWGRADWMWLASYKIYELLNLEMSFCYCQCTAGVFVWVTKKKNSNHLLCKSWYE